MKVLTWNTAGASGTSAAVALADRVGADVVFLQEAAPAALWSGPLVGAAVRDCVWGSWILARTGMLTEITVANYSGWVAGARWCNADDVPTYLFSIHSPTKNANEPRGTYAEESAKIVAAICDQVPLDARLVIGGDFNFKSLGERLPTEQIPDDRAEIRALQDFRKRGLTVVWRDLHAERTLPQTLRWRRDPTTPFHCDGFLTRGFVNPPISCEILCADADVGSSDHNPVVLQLPVPASWPA